MCLRRALLAPAGAALDRAALHPCDIVTFVLTRLYVTNLYCEKDNTALV
jgi:hypothetical protein